MPEDIHILSDTTVDGVRHIKAVHWAAAGPRTLSLDRGGAAPPVSPPQPGAPPWAGPPPPLRYPAGCHGNLQALGALLEGQSVSFALDRLTGINCKERGTSCSDQLTRVLRAVL